MEIKEVPCSEYCEDDYGERHIPCKCPKCGGFLKWNIVTDTPVCNKCGVELLVIPNIDEETGKVLAWGKICATGEPKPKAIRKEGLRTKRLCKAGYKIWKAFL